MQMPIVDIPLIGRSGAIALIALVHVMFANFALGGPLITIFSEWWALRTGDERYDRFAYGLARVTVVAFSVGATLGVGLVALLAGLWPVGWTRILNMYFWPLALEVVFFFLEGALLYYYVYTWQRRGRHIGLHIAWGVAAVIAGLGTLLIINGVAAAMLTPQANALALGGGGPEVLLTKIGPLYFDNPTWLPLSLHRIVGALSFTGFLLATVSAAAGILAVTAQRKAHFRWLSGYGLRFGLLPLLLMPPIGFLYVNEIRVPAMTAFVSIMMGEIRWAFNFQIVVLAGLFLLCTWYLLRLLRGYGLMEGGFEVARLWVTVSGALALALGVFVAWYGISQNSPFPFRGAWENVAIVVLLLLVFTGALALLRRVHRRGLVVQEQIVLALDPVAASRWVKWPTATGQAGRHQPEHDQATEVVQPLEFKEEVNWARYGEVLWLVMLICAIVAALPYNQLGLTNFPLGQMRPWKYTALIGLLTLTIPILALYFRGRALRPEGQVDPPPVSPLLPLFSGVMALAIMFVMGYVREAARAPWLVFNQLAAKDDVFEAQGPLVTTLPMPFGLAVPLLLFGMLLFALLGLMVLQTAHGMGAIDKGRQSPEPPTEPQMKLS